MNHKRRRPKIRNKTCADCARWGEDRFCVLHRPKAQDIRANVTEREQRREA